MAWNWKYGCFCLRSLIRKENTLYCTANVSPHILCTSKPTMCSSQRVCVTTDAHCPKIECAPNCCCKHRCGKPGFPPPKFQTQHPGHSTLCVPVWKQRKSSTCLCICEKRVSVESMSQFMSVCKESVTDLCL